MQFRFASFVFLPLAVFACSSTSSTTGSLGSDTPCGRYFNALTAFAQRCGETTGVEGLSTAASRFEAVCANEAAAPGATGFNASLETCTQQIGALGCNEELDCEPTGGTLDAGTPCQESFQCKGYCKHSGDNSGNDCGTCAALVAIGAACESSTECGEGNRCGESRKCEASTKSAAGGACDYEGDCQNGLACNTGKCAPPVAIGGACKYSGDCDAHAAECKDSKCTALPGEGATCTNLCAQGLGCGVNQKCAKRDFVEVGAACDDVHLCHESVCVGYSGGSTSTMNSDGSSTIEVTQTAGKCVVPLADGAACSPDDKNTKCSAFAECITGTCQLQNPAVCK